MRNQMVCAVMIGFHVVAAVNAGGCLPSPGVACGNGWCSEGDRCVNPGSATPVCVRSTCGNGVPDPGEECDDGNNIGGDGCSANCIREPACGNHILDPGEQCDDGNNIGGDGCSHDCKLEFCGNHMIDQGEECDDGNHLNGDGCEDNCTLPFCGNRITDPGEECDDGNTIERDGCSAHCTFERCGNGVVDSGEECDDGPDNGTVNSLHHCDLRCKSNLCGNGTIDVGEECDDGVGVRVESARCNEDCTFARCGDGKVNHHFKPDGVNVEVCDNIDRVTNTSLNGVPCAYGDPGCTRCNATCTGNTNPGGPFCGDGIPQRNENETCDPTTGPAATLPSPLAFADSATCNINCTQASCGDGYVNTVSGESCDDGNKDGCGTCTDINCRAMPVAPTAAAGTIRTSDARRGTVSLIADGDTFTLDDGFSPAVTFEFVTRRSAMTQILFDVNDKADVIAGKMADAINQQLFNSNWGIFASRPDLENVVTLINFRKSALGNTTITVSGLVEFLFGNDKHMSGGRAVDCQLMFGCVSEADCASNLCSNGKCQACTSDTQCVSPRHCNVGLGRCDSIEVTPPI